MTERLDVKTSQETMSEDADEARSMGAVASRSSMLGEGDTLYHAGSINPGGEGLFRNNYYDRGVDEYLEALNHHLDVDDVRGKVIVDIGSGKTSRFGRELTAKGAHVLSVNPALRGEDSRNILQQSLDKKHRSDLFWYEETKPRQTRLRRWFGGRNPEPPEREVPNSVAGLGQALPVRENSADIVVSVFGIPQYLHHLDPNLAGDDEKILQEYTAEVRDQDKTLIRTSFEEVVRVLKPGGKAYFADTHRTPGQTKNINPYSPSDGTEVVEVLNSLNGRLAYEIEEAPLPDGSTRRIISLTKLA